MNRFFLTAFTVAFASLLSTTLAETIVTLPTGDSEHFSVQTAAGTPLLRTDSAAILSGTNVAFGTMGSILPIVASTQTVALFLSDSIHGSLIIGSNRITIPQANFIAGHTNNLYMSTYSSILGGNENQIVYHDKLGSHNAAIVGGTRNIIYGSQKGIIGGGEQNIVSNHALYAVIGGGFRNLVTARSGTVPGGEYNLAAGSNTFAAGYRAQAIHDGSFVWADSSTNSTFASSNANEFAVRATGGVRFEAELGTASLPNKKNRYADNNVVAWARVGSNGAIGTSHFGVESCTSFGQGNYEILLDVSMTSPSTLIPVATVDLFGMSLPTNAAQARLVYVERTLDLNRFIVRTTTGAYVPTNTAFNFIVTGR